MEDLPTILHIEYKDQVVGRVFLDITEQGNTVKKIGRVDIKDYSSVKESALVLCMNLPLYQDFVMGGQECELERLWGWGVPFCQMYRCAIQFVKEWHQMTPQQFRDRVIVEFVKWGAEVDIPNIDQYGYIIEAMMQVIYEIKKEFKYINVTNGNVKLDCDRLGKCQ